MPFAPTTGHINVTYLEKIAAEADCPLCAVKAALSPLPGQGAWTKYQTLVKSARVKAAAGRKHSDKCQKWT